MSMTTSEYEFMTTSEYEYMTMSEYKYDYEWVWMKIWIGIKC